MVSTFSWTGSNHGVWNDPSNWTDITSGSVPASAPPGPADEVLLPGGAGSLRIVNGPGQAASMTLSQQLELGGTFVVGSLLQSGTLALISGALSANTAVLDGWVDDIGAAMSAGSLAINHGTLTVEPGAWMEVGTAGTADGGFGLVVDDNATLSGSGATLQIGSVLNRGTITGTFGAGTVLSGTNVGSISGVSLDAFVNDGTIATGAAQMISVGHLTGTGGLQISGGGTLEITQMVTSVVDFLGSAATLDVDATGLPDDAVAVQNFVAGDTILVRGGVLSASLTPNGTGDETLNVTTSAGTFGIHVRGNFNSLPAPIVAGGIVSVALPAPPCFVTGTHIRTRGGDVVVENLRIGDFVITALSKEPQPVRWIGHRTVFPARAPRPHEMYPICVRADAFGPGVPYADLYLSPDHAVFFDRVLIPIKYLVNGGSIAPVRMPAVTYWHVELDNHDVLFAEGLPSESYLDAGDRGCFDNGNDAVMLHPAFRTLAWDANGCAPLVVTGPVVEHLRARLATTARHVLRRCA
jgi:hypothetical protein